MPTKIFSASIIGIEAVPIEVEADIAQGLPNFTIVGLPDAAVQEARQRVRAALKNSKLNFPRTRLTVNLAPAHIKKEGPGYDLPIAIAILEAAGVLESANKDEKPLFVGELALDGSLRPVSGVLSIALMAKQHNFSPLYVPVKNLPHATAVQGLNIIPVKDLRSLAEHLTGKLPIQAATSSPLKKEARKKYSSDFTNIRGQEQAKRALEIAAAGGHNVLMTGPPGSGKTLLARSFPSILPEMTTTESLEVTQIHSVARTLPEKASLLIERPFRSPHHTTSHVALVGGGSSPHPGEISLAHRGVLFLDEFPEFGRVSIEALRQPLEDGVITIARAAGTVCFPAQFTLIAAQNPCPCGFATDQSRACNCSAALRDRYMRKVSGPLLDRIDLHISVPRIPVEKMASETPSENSFSICERVTCARRIQEKRFRDSKIHTNSEMNIQKIKKFCVLGNKEKELLITAANKLKLSARAWSRVLKISRTIADLSSQEQISTANIAEALQYRPQQE